MLFDAGPDGDLWKRNATRMSSDLSSVEHVHLSHWHRDHSGGLLTAIKEIAHARPPGSDRVVLDLHPGRPDCRGWLAEDGIVSMELEASLEEFTAAGASVYNDAEPHLILHDTALVSGEIPRRTGYELGIPTGMRFISDEGKWQPDPLIMDERFVMFNMKGK